MLNLIMLTNETLQRSFEERYSKTWVQISGGNVIILMILKNNFHLIVACWHTDCQKSVNLSSEIVNTDVLWSKLMYVWRIRSGRGYVTFTNQMIHWHWHHCACAALQLCSCLNLSWPDQFISLLCYWLHLFKSKCYVYIWQLSQPALTPKQEVGVSKISWFLLLQLTDKNSNSDIKTLLKSNKSLMHEFIY